MAVDTSDQTCRVIRQSRLYIKDPTHWTKRHEMTGGDKYTPHQFCAIGIVKRVAGELGCSPEPALQRLTIALPDGYHDIPLFNDAIQTKHADVVSLFERAERGCK